jgi:hypothetical protein
MLPQQRESLTNGCCHACAPLPRRPSTLRSRRGWDLVAGVLSLGLWVFMPKCPMCVAAHVALWTGIGISFSEAATIRWSLLFLSGALVCYVFIKRRVRLKAA